MAAVVQDGHVVVCFCPVREQLREQTKQYEKSENDLKALQSVGQVRSKAQCVRKGLGPAWAPEQRARELKHCSKGLLQLVEKKACQLLFLIPADRWRGAEAADGGEVWVTWSHSVYTVTLTGSSDQVCLFAVIVKATNGPRYVVGCRRQVGVAAVRGGALSDGGGGCHRTSMPLSVWLGFLSGAELSTATHVSRSVQPDVLLWSKTSTCPTFCPKFDCNQSKAVLHVSFKITVFQLDKSQLKPGTRVALDMTTLTIMR